MLFLFDISILLGSNVRRMVGLFTFALYIWVSGVHLNFPSKLAPVSLHSTNSNNAKN
jgi:hypothetical protein